MAHDHLARGGDEGVVALLGVQAADGGDHRSGHRYPEFAAHRVTLVARPGRELFEGRSVEHHGHAILGNEAILDQEVGGRLADRDGVVGQVAQEQVGDLLIRRHVRVGECERESPDRVGDGDARRGQDGQLQRG